MKPTYTEVEERLADVEKRVTGTIIDVYDLQEKVVLLEANARANTASQNLEERLQLLEAATADRASEA